MGTLKALVVAGWWGGGAWRAGWGWGGWVVYNAYLTVTPQAYSVTIGNGWNGSINWNWWNWTNGSNSVFSSITAIGWWYGASENTSPFTWVSGWSGGWGIALSFVWGAWTGWQGNNWWTWWSSASYYLAGWGGGAWAVWWSPWAASSGSNWWVGLSYSISGTATYYGWWGWWGGNGWTPWTWWLGGWGAWQVTSGVAGVSGTSNTGWWGWWGAGTATRWNWWNGWSGIVIISYATDWSDWVSPSSTGGTITTSGGQTIHTFISSGTFTMVASSTNTNPAFLLQLL